MKKEIPIVFSTDDNYAPFLDVALLSLIENASRDYEYRIIILNTGLEESNVRELKRHECPGFRIDLIDVSEELRRVGSLLKNVYHFSLVTYYRLFIASLFPQYDKVIYLDCDLVLLGDVSELFSVDLGDDILAAAPERFVQTTEEFRRYAEVAVGVDPDTYVNAGVLLMNLEQFRKSRIKEKFIRMISEYDFDLLDPDQAYLNYLCRGRMRILPNGWNKEPIDEPCCGKKSIVHYALYKKPWQFDDVIDGEHFWRYARRSSFYPEIKRRREAFGEEQMREAEAVGAEILDHALRIVASEETFSKKITADLEA